MRGPYEVIKISKSEMVVLKKETEEHGKTILLHETKLKKIDENYFDLEGVRNGKYENSEKHSDLEEVSENEKQSVSVEKDESGIAEKAEQNMPRKSRRKAIRKSCTEYF